MKWIIYTLLLVNIGVFVWHYRMPLLNQDAQQPVVSESRLIQLSEFKQQRASKAANSRCFSLGPFSSSKKVNNAQQQLSQWGIETSRRESEEHVREGFWVLLPPASSREAARATIRELKLKGEKDFFLVVSGQQLNGISLGVFTKTESAQRRLKQIKEKGFEPIVETIHLPNTDYWLDWPQNTATRISDSQLQKIKKQNPEIGQLDRRCPINK